MLKTIQISATSFHDRFDVVVKVEDHSCADSTRSNSHEYRSAKEVVEIVEKALGIF